MDRATLKALKASIKHWETNLIDSDKASVAASDCALCRRFTCGVCKGCPIYEKTRLKGCLRTPYIEAMNAKDKHGYNSPEFRVAALKELRFLESLLP